MFKKSEKFFDILGEILAVVLVIVFALLIINANFPFLPDSIPFELEFLRTKPHAR